MKQTKEQEHEINENGIKPNDENVHAILALKSPNNTKEWKVFVSAIQFLAKLESKLSETNGWTYLYFLNNEPWK